MRIEGSVALVTGAASGLGRAAATRLHASGVKLVLVDTNQDGGKELADEGVGIFGREPSLYSPNPVQMSSVVRPARAGAPARDCPRAGGSVSDTTGGSTRITAESQVATDGIRRWLVQVQHKTAPISAAVRPALSSGAGGVGGELFQGPARVGALGDPGLGGDLGRGHRGPVPAGVTDDVLVGADIW